MRSEKIAEIVTSARNLETETQRLVEFFQRYYDASNRSFDTSQIILGRDSSTSELVSRILSMTAFISKFENARADLVPLNILTQLLAASEDVAAQESNLIKQLELDASNNSGLSQFDYSTFTANMKSGVSVPTQQPFLNLFASVESLLSAFSSNLVVLKPSKGAFNFQGAASALSLLLDGTRTEHDKLKDRLAKTDKVFAQVQTSETEVQTFADEVKRLQKEVASDRQTVSEYLAEITQKKADIDSISSKSATLEDQVDEYSAKFESFGRQLEEREAKLAGGDIVLQELTSSLRDQDQKINAAIARSEQMLASSTTAGLASHFHKIHEDLTNEMDAARRSFNYGIWALFISAIPLIILIFSPVLFPLLEVLRPEWSVALQTFSPDKAVNGWQYTGQVLSRFIILLPAAWFVRFSSIRYASLFRLREHYAYKYSMAVSVDGFKKQAVGYEDEIAALVLEQLAFNPADKLIASKDMMEGKVPHPLLNFLMAKIDKRLKALNADEK